MRALHQVLTGAGGVFMQLLLDLRPVPAVLFEDAVMFRRDAQDHVRRLHHLGVDVVDQLHRQRPRQFLAGTRAVVGEAGQPVPLMQGDGVAARLAAARDVQRRPGGIGFIFGEAIGELARVAEHGPVDFARPSAADIADDQL